ncbi:MAG: desulfoferrodoxin [Clostridia bacterium]|nr:desulfoferrodoxin [Clostridia bacterium]
MVSKTRFYLCRKCGNIVGLIHGVGVPIMCCGEEMEHLEAKINDSGKEKHIPVVNVATDRVKVNVGSQAHPMENEHAVEWIYLQTDRGGQRKCLKVDGKPFAEFALCDEKPEAVYAYCNKHGLWMAAL